MPIHIDDDAFVRAPAPLVYRRLTDLRAYGDWWPGVTATRLEAPKGSERYALVLRRSRARRPLRLVVEPHDWRHNAGFRLTVDGDLIGEGEFWLEEGWGGTVVHHLLTFETSGRRPQRRLRDYRQVLRRGFWAFKDLIQSEVRTRSSLSP